jgi:hypothetical protein
LNLLGRKDNEKYNSKLEDQQEKMVSGIEADSRSENAIAWIFMMFCF